MNESSKQMIEEFIHGTTLGHCDCHHCLKMSEASLKYIQKILNIINSSEPQDLKELNRFFYDDDGLKYTIFYVLNKYKLTEHIFLDPPLNSIPGKLTLEGNDLLKELNELYPRN